MAVLTRDLKYRKPISKRLARDESRGLYHLSFRAMGTACSVKFDAEDAEQAIRFSDAACEWVGLFEGKYSRFLDTSLLSEINREAGRRWVDVDEETERIFGLCDDLNFMTHGQLDPTALPLIRLWDYRRQPRALPSPSEVSAAKALVGWQKLERRPGQAYLPREGMCLDFGGFGKEYAVDKVAALAKGRGIERCLVDFGQDIHVLGTPMDAPAWHVGLEDPRNPGSAWASLALQRPSGVATSGDYHRHFLHEGQRFGHIIDLVEGRPVAHGLRAVTVVAPSCLEAGALSTAAFVLGPEKGMELIEGNFGAEGCFVACNSVLQTSHFYEYIVER